MASITVRNLDDGLKRRLRIRAAENGRSMEQEAREILRAGAGCGGGANQKPRNGDPRTIRALRRRGVGHPAKRPDARTAKVRLNDR